MPVGFDGRAFDQWLTTDPRTEPTEDACVICGEEPEIDYDGGCQWGTVEWARNVVPVCCIECAVSVALNADTAAERVQAVRWCWEQLTSSDEYLPITLKLRSGRELIGTLISSAGEHLTVEDEDGGLSIVPWSRVADVADIDI